MDATPNNRPIMQWIEVPDTHGGTRLEARWVVPTDAAPLATQAVAA